MEYSYYSYEDAYICEELEPECKMAVGYAWNNKSRKHEAIDRKSYHDANGAGGVISNVLDYSRWLRALIYEHGPVSKAGHAAIKTPSSVEAFEKYPYSGPVWYGMGLEGGIYRNIRVFGHGGAIGGYYSHFSFLPDKEWGYVAFQNTPGSIVDIAGWRLLDEFLGTPRDEFAQMNRQYVEWSRLPRVQASNVDLGAVFVTLQLRWNEKLVLFLPNSTQTSPPLPSSLHCHWRAMLEPTIIHRMAS